MNEKLLDCTINNVSIATEDADEVADIQSVDVNSIFAEDCRSFGGEWLSKQALDDSGLPDFLSQEINNEVVENHIAIEVVPRTSYLCPLGTQYKYRGWYIHHRNWKQVAGLLARVRCVRF